MMQELKVGDPVWHIVLAEPRREDATAARLRDADFEAYAPIITKEVKAARGRKREIRAAMFPSYLFVSLPYGGADYYGVRGVRGVYDFLTIDGWRAFIKESDIDRIRAKEAALEARRQRRLAAAVSSAAGDLFEVGQEVMVTVGPFEKLVAKIESIDPRGRVEVLLAAALLGRRQCAVELAHLQAIS